MSYEYLVASLPLLTWGAPPPFSAADFRFRCGGVLSAADAAALDRLLAGRPDPDAGGFEGAWAARETQLRNAVAAARAPRHGADARAGRRPHAGWDGTVEQAAMAAFVKEQPLEREGELDRGRWRVLDDLARGAPFGAEAVLAFALKLRIAERWAGLNDEAGRARFDALVGDFVAAAAPRGASTGTDA